MNGIQAATPAIDTGALKAFSCQIAEKEAERTKIEHRLAQAGSVCIQDQDRLKIAMQKAYQRACDDFFQITTESHLNRFVEAYIGPMLLTADGRIKPKRLEMTTASESPEAVVNIAVAGGGFEPPTSGL